MPIQPLPADLVRMTRYELRAYAATSFAAGQHAARELQRRQLNRFQRYEDEMMRVETLWTRLAELGDPQLLTRLLTAVAARGAVNPWALRSRRPRS